MTWLVWRQHRQQALAAVVALLAVALLLVPTGRQMRAAFDDLGLRSCLPGADHSELVAPDGGCASLSEQFSGRFDRGRQAERRRQLRLGGRRALEQGDRFVRPAGDKRDQRR